MKAKCPECRKQVKVEDGIFIPHDRNVRVGKSTAIVPCVGSGQRPRN